MPQPGQRIPANLITGFLGAGKTTAIRSLLPQRTADERWSIFVNEYGMVSIDQLLLEENDPTLNVQELAGGCFCCTTSFAMTPMLAQFIRLTQPDRLIIEPTGAGHPARVIDTLRGPGFRQAIDLRATICLVDPKDFENPRVVNSEVFHDQIQMADVVVLNFLDRRDPAQTRRCRQWIERFDPPKLLVAETSFGQLDRAWLDLEATVVRPPRFSDTHADHADHGAPHHPPEAESPVLSLSRVPQPGQPLRFENSGQGQSACGWVFSAADCFDRRKLYELLDHLQPIVRIKGVFHCEDDWWAMNRGRDVNAWTRSAYRRDSRLEIIVDTAPLDWQSLETRLVNCLAVASPTAR